MYKFFYVSAEDATCPSCLEGIMEHYVGKKEGCPDFHVWTCQDCPAVAFEFHDIYDLETLKEFLRGRPGDESPVG